MGLTSYVPPIWRARSGSPRSWLSGVGRTDPGVAGRGIHFAASLPAFWVQDHRALRHDLHRGRHCSARRVRVDPSVTIVAIGCIVIGFSLGFASTATLVAAQSSVEWNERDTPRNDRCWLRCRLPRGARGRRRLCGGCLRDAAHVSGRPSTSGG